MAGPALRAATELTGRLVGRVGLLFGGAALFGVPSGRVSPVVGLLFLSVGVAAFVLGLTIERRGERDEGEQRACSHADAGMIRLKKVRN
jgi:hypothetical protein